MSGRPQTTIMANPVLVGAATLLITLVGVFLAYNANSGLPFVPSYEIKAVVPDAAELVRGNDVRVGGKRVGTVSAIRARRAPDGTATSVLTLKLEKPLEPLPVDTKVTVRPRSTLGLKYLELQPGTSPRGIAAGGTIPARNAGEIVSLDEVLNAFDAETRDGIRRLVEPLAGGLAGRAADLNRTVEALSPAVALLRPVARNLRLARTDLRGFIAGVESAATAFAPAAISLGELVEGAALTFAAVDAERTAFGDLLERAPRTERVATRALAATRPVLRDAARLVEALRPGTRLLPVTTRRLTDAIQTGTPVLREGTRLGPDLEGVLRAVEAVAKDPATPIAVKQLTSVVASLEPTLRYVNPFQTVCNYLGLWTRNASSTISEGDANGTWFRFVPVFEIPETLQSSQPAARLHNSVYANIDGECEVGNEDYVPGQRIGPTPEREPFRTEETSPATFGGTG